MRTLNPGRVFAIKMPLDAVAGALARARSRTGDLATGCRGSTPPTPPLPGRIELEALTPALDAALARAIAAARGGTADARPSASAAAGLHRAGDAAATTASSTAPSTRSSSPPSIRPAPPRATTTYKGEKLPDFGVTGVWPLIRRTNGRGILGMVDYLSPNPGYGFISMLPYQYAGGITYNAFHNAGVRCQLNSTPFLPATWRKVAGERSGKPYENLWIVSRGPTSHGCTRLASGHMSELRQIVPSESDTLAQVKTYRNLRAATTSSTSTATARTRSWACSTTSPTGATSTRPVKRLRQPTSREPFYRWLYGDNVALGPVGQTRIKSVPVCRFVGTKKAHGARDAPRPAALRSRRSRPSRSSSSGPRSAFDSAPGFELNRELRKIGAGHTLDRARLLLK